MAKEPTSQELGQRLYTQLDTAAQDLATQLRNIQKQGPTLQTIEASNVHLSRLRKDFTDAVPNLPSHDQANLDRKIKAIEVDLEKIRAAAIPKTKFAFRRKAANTTPTPSTPVAQSLTSAMKAGDTPSTSGLLISGHSHKFLTLSSVFSQWPSATDLTISDLDHCIVNLVPSPTDPIDSSIPTFTALHAKNLSSTILILPIVQGSALLHDMKNCVIALGSRQFRIHASSGVDVYITASSKPIIEHCSAMRFATYPTYLRRPTSTANSTSTEFHPPDAVQNDDNHLSVQDFSHIRATPSPNWAALPEEAAIQEGQWPLSLVEDVDVVLRTLIHSQ